jgi:hypothetical protein
MEIRYVGGTIQGIDKRLKQHIWSSTCENSKNYPVYIWIRSLILQGIEPIIVLLHICNTENYEYDERVFILACRAIGCDLLNVRDGGQLGSPNRCVSQLTRKRIGVASKGRVAGMSGKSHSEESNEKNRQAHIGKKHSEASIIKMSKAQTGKKKKPFTQEARYNMSIAHLGKTSPNKGKKFYTNEDGLKKRIDNDI